MVNHETSQLHSLDPICPPYGQRLLSPARENLPTAPGCTVERNSSFESEVLALINNYRESNGLGLLALNELLTAASVMHDTDMACHYFSDHRGTDGRDWFGRLQNQGYNYVVALENIYSLLQNGNHPTKPTQAITRPYSPDQGN